MNDLNTRLANHIAIMAPHQMERQGAELLVEAAARIIELEKELVSLQRYGLLLRPSDPVVEILCTDKAAKEPGLPGNDKWVQEK